MRKPRFTFFALPLLAFCLVACSETKPKSQQECETHEDCPEGYSCIARLGTCALDLVPYRCSTAEDCAPGYTCHLPSGKCIPVENEPDGDQDGDTDEEPGVPITEDELTVTSPDGTLALTLAYRNLQGLADYPDSKRLYYRLERNGEAQIDWSPLGIHLDQADFVDDLRLVRLVTTDIQEAYTVISGKRREQLDICTQAHIRIQSKDDQEMTLEIRVYDTGAAFRYHLHGEAQVTVLGEVSGFRLPDTALAWMQPMPHLYPLQPAAYENPYQKVAVGQDADLDGWVFPALFRLSDDPTAPYVLLTEANLTRPYAGTRLHETVSHQVYRIRFPSPKENLDSDPLTPIGTLPFATPWRVIILGTLADLVASDMVLHLSEGIALEFGDDLSWIKPGRVAWSWWSQDTGTPSLQYEYIDFASEIGWEYILIDAGWDKWENTEAEIMALTQYAEERSVGVLLWYNSSGPHRRNMGETPVDRMYEADIRRAEMERLADWGVKGIKVDFFESDKPARIAQYLDILEDARDHRLMVNFHGSTVPRGWRRAFPNLMTMEAVYGGEFYKFPATKGPKAADHVYYVFTRNIVGSMDYTPVVFEKAFQKRGLSYSHQLALSILFESAWQHFADNADADTTTGYRKIFSEYPYVREFLREVPVVWDETRLLSGDPDSHAILARRNGDTWYVAGITAEIDEPLALDIPLDFLETGAYTVQTIDSTAEADGFVASEKTLSMPSESMLSVRLATGDGFVSVLRR